MMIARKSGLFGIVLSLLLPGCVAEQRDFEALRDRSDAVAVEPGAAVGEVVGGEVEIAVGLLHRPQESEPAANRVGVAIATGTLVGMVPLTSVQPVPFHL